MKSSIIVCQLDSGALHSVAHPTYAEADKALSLVRKTRSVKVGKEAVPVVIAVLITQNSQSAQVIKMVNCKAEANREAIDDKAKAEAQNQKK